ncbi:MAG TPA: hypothetical protein VFA78_03485, partial [Chloroflexota bacterium]|nr:hypothetical protein [Chloroflexota bacterium]
PASDGSVWAVAQAGDYQMVDGVQGARRSSLWLARWDEHGKPLLPPTLVDSSATPLLAPFAAAARGRHVHVYFPYPPNTLLLHTLNGQPSLTAGQSGSNAPLIDETFDQRGVASRFERVNFDSGGDVASPEAVIRGGRPQVLWEKVTANGAVVEGTVYHHAQPPDLTTRLGLNIGNLWGNLLFIVVAGLGFGVVITTANVLLLGILIALWLPAGRLPPLVRWPVYIAAVAAVLAWIFVARPAPPGWIAVISALGTRSGWFGNTVAGLVAVAAAIFVSGWLSRAFWSRQDDLVRAVLTAISAVYVIAVLAAVAIVQAQLQQT